MAVVTVHNLQSKTILVKDKSEKLLNALLSETDWMHACGGKGKCTTCKATIVTGEENLEPLTEAETRFVNMGRLKQGERLTCQTLLKGDVTIAAPKEYQLPHIKYSV